MIGGVSFQPGGADPTKATKSSQGNVQEAIKVLSLRLPKTVGAKALAPAALLNAQGSGGNTRVDSVVSTVLNRFLPGGPGAGQAPPTAPMVPTGAGANFSPTGGYPPNTPLAEMMQPQAPPGGGAPRITPGDDQPAPPVITDEPKVPQGRVDMTPGPSSPLPGYDRETGWQGAPSAPPAPTQDPWADLMEYLRRQPAPPPEVERI